MTPKRIQRRRVKGWKMPEGAVYVGRPTKWGNPYGGTSSGLARYRDQVLACLPIEELRGKDLACWCKLDQPCHADILLELANLSGEPEDCPWGTIMQGSEYDV